MMFSVLVAYCFIFFFFFQAEDGIRDLTVTGVQTCALPISAIFILRCGSPRAMTYSYRSATMGSTRAARRAGIHAAASATANITLIALTSEIGRASCRERV